ncbi:hypothetical protein LTR85_000654 [Meristemomyces frigidus]|nr:hypothetical protein LTR85_000654 [Meristemomyces frigidus]
MTSLAEHPPADYDERQALCEAARALYISLERPLDTMHRLFWSVSLSPPSMRLVQSQSFEPLLIGPCQVAQLPVVQVGIDMGVFRSMAADPGKNWTIEMLAEKVGSDQVLLYRLLRYLGSFGLLQENPDSTYSATATTAWLATEGAEGGVKHYQQNISPVLAALPETLKQQGYRNPSDSSHTAFQLAHHTDKPAYSWVPPDHSGITAFVAFMKAQREGQKAWTDSFPIAPLKLSDSELEGGRTLFVDVGGSTGQQCMALRQQYPSLHGGVVLQEQERIIAAVNKEALASYGIDAQAHDFFQEQPVKGAKAYYMRNIMHDWPDGRCIAILQRLRDACADDSMVLIDEMVLPDQGASWKQAQKDIQMMAALAAMERSEAQWKELLAKAGLKIQQVCTYDKEMGDSVIIAVKA